MLPNEDPAEIAALRDRWFDDAQPRTAAEHFLVEECFHAHLMAQRFHRAHDSAVADHIEEITEYWEAERRKLVQAMRANLAVDPAGAVAELKGIGHGCRWLIGRWEWLQKSLAARGYWAPAERDEAIRLFGARPEPERLCEDGDAYLIFQYNVRSQPGTPDAAIEALLQPERRPAAFRTRDRDEMLPDLEVLRGLLEGMIAEELASLRAAEHRLRTGRDAEELARAVAPASLLTAGDEARRLLRYHAEYRSTFHRAHNALVALQKRAAEEGREETPGDADRAELRGSAEGAVTAAGDDCNVREDVGGAPAGEARCAAPRGTGPADEERAGGPAGAVEAGPRNEPSHVTEIRVEEQVDCSAGAVEAGSRNDHGPDSGGPVAPATRDEPGLTTVAPPPGEGPVARRPEIAPVAASKPGPVPETNPTLGRGGPPLLGPGADRIARNSDPFGRSIRVDQDVNPRRLWDLEDCPREDFLIDPPGPSDRPE